MKIRFVLITVISLMQFIKMTAQSLDSYKWKNRIVLIISNNEYSKNYQEQLEVLTTAKSGLSERKVIVCRAFPSQFIFGFGNFTWIHYPNIYDKYHTTNENFEVLLIGLDGEVKLRQTELLGIEKIFSTIDVMPMRQAELNGN